MEPFRCSKKGFSGTGIVGKFRHLITERSKLCLNKMSITSYIKLKGDVASQYIFFILLGSKGCLSVSDQTLVGR